MMKKTMVALALLLGATSASFAYSHHRAYYDFAPGYGHGSLYMRGGAPGAGASGDMGIGSQR